MGILGRKREKAMHARNNDRKASSISEEAAKRLIESNIEELKFLQNTDPQKVNTPEFKEKLMAVERDRIENAITYSQAKKWDHGK